MKLYKLKIYLLKEFLKQKKLSKNQLKFYQSLRIIRRLFLVPN